MKLKGTKKSIFVISVIVFSTIIAFYLTSLISKVPALIDQAVPGTPKSDIADNKELLKVLRTVGNPEENGYPQFLKLKSEFYKPDGKYYVTPEVYESNIKYLAENGYSTITLKDFIKVVKSGQKVPPKTVLLYSDTTRSSFYELAYPILKKYNFTATLAVETNVVDTPGHLSKKQLRELEDYGIEISSHTMSHPDLTTVSDARLKKEVGESKKLLESWGIDVETFVYPYGGCNDKVIQAVKDAGYIGARATGGPHLTDGGGYASYNEDLLYKIKAALPVNTTTFDEFKEYVENNKIEIEDTFSVYNEVGNNSKIGRVHGDEDDGLKTDSYASVSMGDIGDAIAFTVYAPQSGDYNLTFKVKTGNYAIKYVPLENERSYEYLINGRSYTIANRGVQTSGPFENEPTTKNIIWGYQHINNICLQEGANTVIIKAIADWAAIDCLSVEPLNGAPGIIRHTIPSLDYDGIFYDYPETGVLLAMHGYEHQNPRTGSKADEFDGLSYIETKEKIQKSSKAFNEADLSPTLYMSHGGKQSGALTKTLEKNKLTSLDFPLYEGTGHWNNMKSFDDPRFEKALLEIKKKQPRAVFVNIEDFNKYSKKLLGDYIKSTDFPVTVLVDDISGQTPASKVESLLNLRDSQNKEMNLILGVTPRFPEAKKSSMIAGIFEISWRILLASLVFLNILFLSLATTHKVQSKRRKRRLVARLADGGGLPKVSIVIPMYNEGESARRVIYHALNQTYAGPIEIVIIDDGSSDNTFNIIKEEALQHNNIIGMRQRNKGKPAALNSGIKAATGEIVVSTDGDSFLDKYAVERIVEEFLDDPEVGAVAGFVKVSNEDDSILTRFSQIEYVKEQALFRGCQGFTGDVVICPGPIFAARRQLLVENPSSDRTIVEDCEQTVLIRKAGWKVLFAPDAISETLAPPRIKDWVNQRRRWFYGYLQVWQLIKDFALKKPWMVHWYIGYPLMFLVVLTWLFHLFAVVANPQPYFVIRVTLYIAFSLSFILGTYVYTILLLAPYRVKTRTLLLVMFYPLYEAMVIGMRSYLYIKYLLNDGPTIKFGPRTIHALPDQSLIMVDMTSAAESDDALAVDNMKLLLYLMEQNLSNEQRSGIVRGLASEEKGMLKNMLDKCILLLDQDLDREQKNEVIQSLSHDEKIALKIVLEEVLERSSANNSQDDVEDIPAIEDDFQLPQLDPDQIALLVQQEVIEQGSTYV